MEPVANISVSARPEISDTAALSKKFRVGMLSVQWLNALAASYYFNYVFFYLKEHFGFANGGNLLFTAVYGFVYMLTAWATGPFALKHGYFKTLRLGFTGMIVMMALGGVLPHLLGYSNTLLSLEWPLLAVWSVSTCCTWPTIQSLLSQRQTPAQLSRTAGYYNMAWASANSVSYLSCGWLLDNAPHWPLGRFYGAEILFWVSGIINVAQLLLLPRLVKMDAKLEGTQAQTETVDAKLPPLNPRPISKAKNFLHLAWIANPFAYVAIYGVMPTIPKLAQNLGLTATYASLICSVWFWTRFVSFAWLWHWPGWHYRFRLLLAAFVAMIGSFIAILMSTNVMMLVLAQIVFGLAISLIYYSSLFYSMDVGESKGKRGGFHEAAIGLGIFIGPATGVAALNIFPQAAHADMWGMSALLVIGLVVFLTIRARGAKTA